MDIEQKLIDDKVAFWTVSKTKVENATCNGLIYGGARGFAIKHRGEQLIAYEEMETDDVKATDLDYVEGDKISCELCRVFKAELKEGNYESHGRLAVPFEFPASTELTVISNYNECVEVEGNKLIPHLEGLFEVEAKQGETTVLYTISVIPQRKLENTIHTVDEVKLIKCITRHYALQGMKVNSGEGSSYETLTGTLVNKTRNEFNEWHYFVEDDNGDVHEFWTVNNFERSGRVTAKYHPNFMHPSDGVLVKLEAEYAD